MVVSTLPLPLPAFFVSRSVLCVHLNGRRGPDSGETLRVLHHHWLHARHVGDELLGKRHTPRPAAQHHGQERPLGLAVRRE